MADASLDKQLCSALIIGQVTEGEVRALVARGASPNAQDAGMSALHWAARKGLVDVVRALLELGADPQQRSTNAGSGDTPLHSALWVGAKDKAAAGVASVLLAAGLPVDLPNAALELPIHRAAELGLVATIDVLAPTSPLGARARDGRTALERALVQQKVPAAERLLRCGAPVDDACVALARGCGKRMTSLVESARDGAQPPPSPFGAFAAALAEHTAGALELADAPSAADVRAALIRLAALQGQDVEQGLDANDDVDHFQEEHGDDWLEALADSYWLDHHEGIVRATWEALPDAIKAELPIDPVVDEARAAFEAALFETND